MTLLNDQEKLSLIAADFPLAVDPLEGERGAYARQRIKDVLAGVEVGVVTKAEHLAAIEKERALWQEARADAHWDGVRHGVTKWDERVLDLKTTIAKLTADNAASRSELRDASIQMRDVAASVTSSEDGDHAVLESLFALCRGCGTMHEHFEKVLASPNPGTGWVSPEEHARVADRVRETWVRRVADLDAVAKRNREDVQCLYCGAHVVGGKFTAQQWTVHMATCAAHPMRAVEADRDAARARLADVEEQNLELRAVVANAGLECDEAATDLARVKAEAEAIADDVRSTALEDGVGATRLAEVLRLAARIAALASPTPAQDDDISATSVMLKGGAP